MKRGISRDDTFRLSSRAGHSVEAADDCRDTTSAMRTMAMVSPPLDL
jgi:hypothetical protein